MENDNVDKYYISEQYFLNRFDTIHRKYEFNAKSKEEFAVWKEDFRNELREITGISSMLECEPNLSLLESKQMDGYTRSKYIIETEPEIIMPFYVLIPDDLKEGERRPAILALHGHISNGKHAVAGESFGDPRMEETIKTHNYDYGIQYVKEGFIVFCPDARGFGERREKYYQGNDKILYSSCEYLNRMAIVLGQSATGMWTWDLMRLLDYIETRDDVLSDKIGCAGLSGGGLQTLWLTALDDRISCCVISGYFYGYKQSLLEVLHCACNYVPHLYELADIGDVGALIAPRPVLIETGAQDGLNGRDGLDNVIPQVEKIKVAARIFWLEENVCHDIFEGQHRWNGTKAIPWMKKHLLLE